MKGIGSFAVLLASILLAKARLIPIIYEDYELCSEKGENAGMFDFSDLELVALSDTQVYINGSWNFVKEVKSPWKTLMFTEKYIRSQWNLEMLYKKVPDFCAVIQNPLESWYHVTSLFSHKNCPFPAGTKIHFNMQMITDMPIQYPDTMAGNWRVTLISEFAGGKKECFRIKFDLVEE